MAFSLLSRHKNKEFSNRKFLICHMSLKKETLKMSYEYSIHEALENNNNNKKAFKK